MLYLKEAKFRFFYIFFSFLFTWFCSYFFCNQFLFLSTFPLKHVYLNINMYTNAPFHLIFTELTEIFFVQFKISFLITLIFFFPFILYQLFLFIKPGLYIFEKKIFIKFSLFSIFLTFMSILFTYFFILPSACKFFLSFENIHGLNIYLEAKMDKYLSFILTLYTTTFFFFQFPLLFFFFFKLGFLDLPFLIKKRKFSYLFCLFFSILISPPDFLSQLFFLLPFFFFYELSLFFLFLGVISDYLPQLRQSKKKNNNTKKKKVSIY